VGKNVTRKRRTEEQFKKNRARTAQQKQLEVNQSQDRAPMDKLIAFIVAAVGFAATVVYFWLRI
jgi:hypothetical protein